MRTMDDHAAAAVALATAPVAIEVPVREAIGMVVAQPIRATVPSPPFDNSAMDGFAVRWDDVAAASPSASASPVKLAVVDESRAGVPAAMGPQAGQAVRIMTGAVVPPGADTVVPQEVTTTAGDTVTVLEVRARGAHIRRRGEDAQEGDVVVPACVELAARHVASALTVGVSSVSVYRTPRVGILSTGDELVAPGSPLGDGQIFESNSYFLEAAVRAAGGEPVMLGAVSDTSSVGDTSAEVLAAVSRDGLDLVVTTGGVSVGAYDVVKAALSGAGVEFVKLAMQPGKPQGLGRIGGRPVLCLPGNPVAVAVSFEMFVEPVMRAMRGLDPYRPWHEAVATASWVSPAGREQFIPVRWSDRGVAPATVAGSGSHLMARLAQADAVARVPANVTEVREGDSVMVRRFVE